MRIRIHPYELVPVNPRSGVSRAAAPGPRRGALLRVEKAGVGYADLHPWPELGDLPLAEQLALLARGETTSLTRGSLDFARLDAAARAAGTSLWKGLSIPSSHALVTDVTTLLEGDLLGAILAAGFDRIKLKLGRDWREEAGQIERLAPRLAGGAKLRLDFNEALSPGDFETFVDRLSAEARSAIDFVEDPLPWDAARGFGPRLPIRLAADRASATIDARSLCPDVLVVKPAVQDWRALAARAATWGRALVVTSYLDHPLGQLTAAWAAAAIAATGAQVEACGLLSHLAYEKSDFSERLEHEGPFLRAPQGAGIGWGDALDRLLWRDL